MDNYAAIGRPSKRPRVSCQTPDTVLDEKRLRSDLRLKSRLEAIFEKYGKDFTDTADEIDLATGQIVVDKGHLLAMAGETDTGHTLVSDGHQHSDDWTAAEDWDVRATDSSESHAEEDAWSSADELHGDCHVSDVRHARAQVTTPKEILHRLSHKQQGPNPRGEKAHRRNNVQAPRSVQYPGTDAPNCDVETMAISHTGHRFISMNGPATEPAWQAPPLPTDGRNNPQQPEFQPIQSVGASRERCLSPFRGSLWAPSAARGRPRIKYERVSESRKSPLNKVSNTIRDSLESTPERQSLEDPSPRTSFTNRLHRKLWTPEEDHLLRHLRTTTEYTYIELQSYFPGRTNNSIACRWSQSMTGRRKSFGRDGASTMKSPQSTDVEVVTQSYAECSPSDRSSAPKPIVMEPEDPIPPNIGREDILQSRGIQSSPSSRPQHESVEKKTLSIVHTRETATTNARKRRFSATGLHNSSPCTERLSENSSANYPQTARRRFNPSSTRKPQLKKIKADDAKVPARWTDLPGKGTSNTKEAISGASFRVNDNEPTAKRIGTARSAPPKQKSSVLASSPNPKASIPSSDSPSKRQSKLPRSFGSNQQRQKLHAQSRSLTTSPNQFGEHTSSDDSCELGLDHLPQTTPKQTPNTPAKTPLPFRSGKSADLLRKASKGTLAGFVKIDDSSEDELSTPVKTVGGAVLGSG